MITLTRVDSQLLQAGCLLWSLQSTRPFLTVLPLHPIHLFVDTDVDKASVNNQISRTSDNGLVQDAWTAGCPGDPKALPGHGKGPSVEDP